LLAKRLDGWMDTQSFESMAPADGGDGDRRQCGSGESANPPVHSVEHDSVALQLNVHAGETRPPYGVHLAAGW
jgi:hypothetical protein